MNRGSLVVVVSGDRHAKIAATSNHLRQVFHTKNYLLAQIVVVQSGFLPMQFLKIGLDETLNQPPK